MPGSFLLYFCGLRSSSPLLAVVLADLLLDLVLVFERLALRFAGVEDLARVDHGYEGSPRRLRTTATKATTTATKATSTSSSATTTTSVRFLSRNRARASYCPENFSRRRRRKAAQRGRRLRRPHPRCRGARRPWASIARRTSRAARRPTARRAPSRAAAAQRRRRPRLASAAAARGQHARRAARHKAAAASSCVASRRRPPVEHLPWRRLPRVAAACAAACACAAGRAASRRILGRLRARVARARRAPAPRAPAERAARRRDDLGVTRGRSPPRDASRRAPAASGARPWHARP